MNPPAEPARPLGLLPAPPPRTYKLTKLADVKARPITWLLDGRIPYGALTVLAGRPGQGKSQLTLALAANLTAQGGDVIFVGIEDGLEDTVKPRLIAAGADLSRVHALTLSEGGEEGMVLLPTDVPLIGEAVRDSGASLVIIDPIAAHLAPELNSNNDHSLRIAMSPLARMARKTNAAVVSVSHFNKSRTGTPMDWVGGAVGFTGSARSVLLFGRHHDDDALTQADWRYLCHVKCNGAPLARTVECRIETANIEDDGRRMTTSRVVYGEERADVRAEDLE